MSYHRGGRYAREHGKVLVGGGEDDGDGDGDDEEPEPREVWALDRFCDALLVKGALVPISRKSVILMSIPANYSPRSPSPYPPPRSNTPRGKGKENVY